MAVREASAVAGEALARAELCLHDARTRVLCRPGPGQQGRAVSGEMGRPSCLSEEGRAAS